MQRYYGTKEILARPMTRQEYNDYRGWDFASVENGSDEGYLVEYVNGGGKNHPDHDGYISWSPKDVFEAAYQFTDCMSFGHALVALKAGRRVARAGWNSKGMFIWMVRGNDPADSGSGYTIDGIDWTLFDAGDNGTITRLPHINMRSASGATVTGWLASQTDMLAEDWQIVD